MPDPVENKNTLSNEKLELWLSFLKFFLGSVVVTLVSLYVNSSLEQRELENSEMQLVGTYIDYALTKEVGARKRFSEYFATVIRSDEQRQRWKSYDSLITIEYNKMLAEQDSLKQIVEEEEKQKDDEVKQKTTAPNLTKKEKEDIIEEIESRYNKKISMLENQISESQSKLEVKPIAEEQLPPKLGIISFEALKNDPLAIDIVEFLDTKRYRNDCFNSARIKNKAGGLTANRSRIISKASVAEIEARLVELLFYKVVVTGKCTTKSLYSIADQDESALIKFKE